MGEGSTPEALFIQSKKFATLIAKRTMGLLRIISVLCLLTLWTINAEKGTPSLAEDMELLKAEIRELKKDMDYRKIYSEMKELKEENMKLREMMSRMQVGQDT